MKILASVVAFFSALIAVLAFVAFLLSGVMCFIVGWGPQGPMDPGWGIAAIITGAICFAAGTPALWLLKRRNDSK
jgi:hypothetical protein